VKVNKFKYKYNGGCDKQQRAESSLSSVRDRDSFQADYLRCVEHRSNSMLLTRL
jgi:hypothetical protein